MDADFERQIETTQRERRTAVEKAVTLGLMRSGDDDLYAVFVRTWERLLAAEARIAALEGVRTTRDA